MADQLKAGDKITVEAVVKEVRSDGVAVLTVPASTSIIPAVILTTVDRLGARKATPAEPSPASPSAPLQPRSPFPVGAAVINAKGDNGVVIEPIEGVYRIRRLQNRSDCVMVQWQGRSLPTWEAPEEVQST